VFAKAGCDACHRGVAMADNASADVGTGGKYDVPSLLGLGQPLRTCTTARRPRSRRGSRWRKVMLTAT